MRSVLTRLALVLLCGALPAFGEGGRKDAGDFLEMMNQPAEQVLSTLQALELRYEGTGVAELFEALVSLVEKADQGGDGAGLDKLPSLGEKTACHKAIQLIADMLYACPTPELGNVIVSRLSDTEKAPRRAALLAAPAVADRPPVRSKLTSLAARDATSVDRAEAVLALLALGESRDADTIDTLHQCKASSFVAVRDAAAVAIHDLEVSLGRRAVPPLDRRATAPATIPIGPGLLGGYSMPMKKLGEPGANVLLANLGSQSAGFFDDPQVLKTLTEVFRVGGTALLVNPTAADWPVPLLSWARDNHVPLPSGRKAVDGPGLPNFADYRALCSFPYRLDDEQGDAAQACWTQWASPLEAPVLTLDRTGALLIVQEKVLGTGRLVLTTVNLAQKRVYRENVLRWIYGDLLLTRLPAYQEPRYGMDVSSVTPHRAWATEWAGGRPNVVWISDEPFKRGLLEIQQRIGISWRFVPYDAFAASTTAWKMKGAVGPSVMGQRATDLLAEALPAADVLVLDTGKVNMLWGMTLTAELNSVMGLSTVPSNLRRRIARRVNSGMGLVVVANKDNAGPDEDAVAMDALMDFSGPMLPFAPSRTLDKRVRASGSGRGRRVWFHDELPHTSGFIGAPADPDLPASFHAPGLLGNVVRIHPEEYKYALLAKTILWAAQKDAVANIRDVVVKDTSGDVPLAVEVILDREFRGTLECSFRNRYDELSAVTTTPVDGRSAVLRPGILPGGPQVVETVLKDGTGKTADFAAVPVQIQSTLSITGMSSDKRFYREKETAQIAVGLMTNQDGTASVIGRDTYGREVFRDRKVIKKGDDRLSVAVPISQPLSRLWDIAVALLGGDAVMARERLPIGIERPFPDIDFDVESGMPPAHLIPLFKERLAVDRIIGDPEVGIRQNFDFGSGCWNQSLGASTTLGASVVANERVPCLSDPGFRLRAVRDLRDHGPLWRSLGINSYMVDDESPLGPPCLSAHSLYAFRRLLRKEFLDVDALNREWGSAFRSWDDVVPFQGTDPARPGSFVDYAWFQMWEFADYCSYLEMLAGDVMPGFTAGHSGGVSDNLMLEMSGLLYYYAVDERVVSMMRRPDGVIGAWYRPGYDFNEEQETVCRHWPWWHLFRGTTRMCLWYTAYGGSPAIHGDLRPYMAFVWLGEEMRDLRGSGLGKLIRSSQRDPGRCAVYSSERSFFTRHAVQRLGGSASEALGSPSEAFLRQQYECRYVSEYQVERGEIARRGTKLLLLPGVVSLSERERQELRKFVQGGGTLVADATTGLRNEHGTWVGDGFLREVFGVSSGEGTVRLKNSSVSLGSEVPDCPLRELRRLGTFGVSHAGKDVAVSGGLALGTVEGERPALVMKKSGAGRCLFLNFPFPGEPGSAVARALAADLAALAGIEPVVRFDADVDVPPLDFGLFRDGDALYVGMVMRGAGGRVSEEKPQDLRIELPARRHYYDSRAGKYLGEGREVRDRVTPSIAKVYAGLPGRITKVDAVMEKKGYRRGQTAMARISVTAEPAVSWRQVLRIRVARPDGKEETAYARTVLMEQGRVSLDLPLALDAPAGRWELSVRDAATGAHGQCLFEVQE